MTPDMYFIQVFVDALLNHYSCYNTLPNVEYSAVSTTYSSTRLSYSTYSRGGVTNLDSTVHGC